MTGGLKSKHNEAAAIVADMTLQEKAKLASGKNFWHLEASERHDLPAVMVTDGPHGLRKQNASSDHVGLNVSVPATCFPTACALACSWDTDLLQRVGHAIGEECVAEQVTVLLGPGVNIKRHPYCGRNFEYFSEDPYLTGKMAAALINGVQANGVGTSIKHYAVNNQEQGRMIIDAIVDERTLREIYLRGFEIAIKEAQPWTVMCAYNRVNGTYCSDHTYLLNEILRDEWGFEGLVVTDWGATNDRVQGVRAGLDLEMPGSGGINDALIESAVSNGELDETELDRVIARNVSVSLLGKDLAARSGDANHATHHDLARHTAAECAVLLKNEDSFLPLHKEQSIALIGAFAEEPRYQGTGSSQVNPTSLDKTIDTFKLNADHVEYCRGYDPKRSDEDPVLIAEATGIAQQCDVAVVFVGLPPIYESEGFDRVQFDLPVQHTHLVEAVCAANPNTVVVLSNGSPIAMPWVDQPKAILEGYLAGQAGGSAIAEVLLGLREPGGRLAETFPVDVGDVAADKHFPGNTRQVQYREGLYVGYRYFDSTKREVLFPFGHGLSYTNIELTDIAVSNDTWSTEDADLHLSVTARNLGTRAGSEVIQVYLHDKVASVYRPDQELRAFTKVHLEPGEAATIQIPLTRDAFSFYDPSQARWVVESGDFELRVGKSSRDIVTKLNLAVQSSDTVMPNTAAPKLTGKLVVTDDEAFAGMLGYPIPDTESSRPFHLNSSIQEIRSSLVGAQIAKKITAAFTANMGGESNDETLKKMFEEMANNMPLRSLALFSRGRTGYADLEQMLALLNHQYIKYLKLKFFSDD
ncbi:MAG: glycosyl hydrolase [Pseudomonadales bacterium]|nr:glycosyl hydrolase [Pseudomonadales bacterium]